MIGMKIMHRSRTTISQDVQIRFSVRLAFAIFLSKIKGNIQYSASIMDTALPQKFPFILDRNLAKANCTENHVCTSCDNVVLVTGIKKSLGKIKYAAFSLEYVHAKDA